MESLFSFLIVIVIFTLVLLKRQKNTGTPVWKELFTPTGQGRERVASDGHTISAQDDISCARFGHDHSHDPVQEGFPEAQFIVHNEPQEGYINLNGKILKRSEADEYMRRHG